MTADLLTRQPQPLKVGEPSKRWKNSYLTISCHYARCTICSDRVALMPGDGYIPCCASWPSEQEARNAAQRAAANPRSSVSTGQMKYLGPVPVSP